jgi:hypothetical protein
LFRVDLATGTTDEFLRLPLEAQRVVLATAPDGDRLAVGAGPALWIVDAAGTVRRANAAGSFQIRAVHWAPDGHAIAYVAADLLGRLEETLGIAAADGSGSAVVLQGVPLGRIDWLPDGRIAYAVTRGVS